MSSIWNSLFPSPKLIFLLGNGEYMAMMKEKLLEIKRFCRIPALNVVK